MLNRLQESVNDGRFRAKRALVVSPHSDDAAFSCALAISNLVTLGFQITILTAFSRSSYQNADGPGVADVVTSLRKKEDETFASLLSPAISLNWLDYPDAPLRGKSMLQIFDMNIMDAQDCDIVNRLARDIADSMVTRAIIIAPSAIGGHIDHRIACHAAIQLLPVCDLYLYEDLPYAASWECDLVAKRQRSLAARFGAHANLVFAVKEPVFKKKAALCYESQINSEWLGQIESHFERLWRLSF